MGFFLEIYSNFLDIRSTTQEANRLNMNTHINITINMNITLVLLYIGRVPDKSMIVDITGRLIKLKGAGPGQC